ncbi:CRISP/Allergen/PR-1-like [Dermacentor silvarum]|uniref:CRISP/Allergen/PR-1-like n=1 Tax=Dermacentor silvarum TaxID=543639 RepID=UPI002101C69A|nr:CRISP/Allergen/PR-1-like [Dermacentor silvarum]
MGYPDAQYLKPRYLKAQYPKPRYLKPQYPKPQYPKPRYLKPRYLKPSALRSCAGVSKADRSLILKLHNSYRSQVAQGRLPGFPTATDMFRMRWDDEMADVAQAHSNQCTEPGYAVDHDDQLDRSTSRFDLTGQNLAWAGRHWSPPTPNWTFIIDSWFNEYQYYSPQDVREFNPYTARQTKHFTQIIWAKSRYVGCGYVNYSFTDPSATPPYMEMYACNYAPTGNVVNVRAKLPIYDEGPTCSACPDNARCDQTTGLCGGKGRRPQSPLPPPPAGKVPDPQPSPNPVTAQPGSGGGGSGGQSGKSPGTDTSSDSPAEEDEPPSWLPFIAGLVAVTVALTCCLYFAFARRTKDQPQEQQAAPAGMGSQYSTASTTAL